ncbi:hypothetical protein Pelo_11009 [Pelomyxa schiedti]|nr:hypothetical protein Pelo_11009 [Pelomyxa schiedti]
MRHVVARAVIHNIHLSLFFLLSLCFLSESSSHVRRHYNSSLVPERTNSTLYTPPTSYITYLCSGVPISSTDGSACTTGKVTSVTTSAVGTIGSLTELEQSATRDVYAYRPGYYFDSTGCVKAKSVFDCIKRSSTVDLYSEFSGFNSVILNSGAAYSLSNAVIEDVTTADGKDTSDFTGLGAGIAVFGGTKLSITNTTIYTRGVAKSAIFVDSGGIVSVEKSKITSWGGTLYSDYVNNAGESSMVAAPWTLGVMGTSRTVLLLGDYPTLHMIDSEVAAAQWAVLSIDLPENPVMNVVNTKITLLGADYPMQQANSDGTVPFQTPNPYTNRSGYGTYLIGDAITHWYGVTLSVGTQCAVLTGGKCTWTDLVAGETYVLYDAYGSASKTYTATESKVSTLLSDTFGFAAHEFNSSVVIERGTVVTTGWTTFVVMTGCSASYSVTSGSVISSGNGILMQVMDNDDTTTGTSNLSPITFNTFHSEAAGWPAPTSAGSDNKASLTLDAVTVTGDIYHGAGYYGQKAPSLEVTLSNGATLNAAIAATATIHVTYEGSLAIKNAQVKASESWVSYQNTYFTINEYFSLAQVANKLYYNGYNNITVTVDTSSTWVVTAESLITTLSNSGTIYGTLTSNSDGTLTIRPSSTTLPIGYWTNKKTK